MLAPSLSSTRVAEAHRAEHTARIREIRADRLDPTAPVPTLSYRLMTVRRLAAERLADLGHAARTVTHRPASATATQQAAGHSR